MRKLLRVTILSSLLLVFVACGASSNNHWNGWYTTNSSHSATKGDTYMRGGKGVDCPESFFDKETGQTLYLIHPKSCNLTPD
ncbi:MAG TPA: hypothetical protein VLF89_05060 [Candidatus Saccharimonadales bacterium]|nr:hypothetical protein [Candidatus Saccharimonadales bacterium]HSW97167.1 hypothetical protein [Candidatus Saccharimonadales bacterium]